MFLSTVEKLTTRKKELVTHLFTGIISNNNYGKKWIDLCPAACSCLKQRSTCEMSTGIFFFKFNSFLSKQTLSLSQKSDTALPKVASGKGGGGGKIGFIRTCTCARVQDRLHCSHYRYIWN